MRLAPLGLFLLACGGDGPGNNEDCDASAEPGMEIGVGSDVFQTLDEAGGEAELVHGAQGGYHLELGLRADGLDVSQLASTVFKASIGGQKSADSSTWVQFRCNPDSGAAEAWNVRLIFDEGLEPADLAGETADITADVTDAAGTNFEADASVLIVDPLAR